MATDDLVEQLRVLRVRAGNPSVRELEKLTTNQGPARAMSRATIQDKFSGKSMPKMAQVLALVQACAEYARSIGAPLPPEETAERIWRERIATVEERPSTVPAASGIGNNPAPMREASLWNLEPLKRAGMLDIVELIQSSEDRPMAEWLPTVVEALNMAGMADYQFLASAASRRPSVS